MKRYFFLILFLYSLVAYSQADHAAIYIYRPKQAYAMLTNIKVSFNDNQVASLKNGDRFVAKLHGGGNLKVTLKDPANFNEKSQSIIIEKGKEYYIKVAYKVNMYFEQENPAIGASTFNNASLFNKKDIQNFQDSPEFPLLIPTSTANNTISQPQQTSIQQQTTTAPPQEASTNTNTATETVAASGYNATAYKKRLALVIGNAQYTHGGALQNTLNDANDMAVALQKVGFEVIKKLNASQRDMKMAIDDFGKRLENYDVGLFYYAGHGIQAKGQNYLIPVEASLASEEQVEYDCIRADRILAFMEDAKSKVNIIILDACRNNPFERSWRRSANGSGLAFMNAPSGSLIAYATAPGNTASDGYTRNGLYTEHLLKYIQTPNLSLLEVFQKVRSDVISKSGQQQTPWESTSLTGNFYFVK